MKKTLLLIVLVATLILSGCENGNSSGGGTSRTKRMVCNQKVSIVDVNMIADFDGDELAYLGLEYDMDLSSYTDAQINLLRSQDMCSTVKSAMSTYTNAFTNCKQSISGKTMVITADFDLDKLLGTGISRKTSTDEVSRSLESQGYSCKLK